MNDLQTSPPPRILIVGAGSVGGYFGGRLAEAGRNVTFLVRRHRAEQLKQSGLKLISPHGDVTITPQLVRTGELNAAYDIVLLTVKAYALEKAMADFTQAVGRETMIVPFLNGMRHLDLLTAQFGPQPVMGGVCLVATSVKDDGSIVQMNELQSLSYGELSGESSPRVEKLHRALSGAGFDSRLSQNIAQEMWDKWIYLATLGGINCLLRGTIGEIEAAPGGSRLARNLLTECSAVAAASGHAPAAEVIAKIQTAVTAPGSSQTSSMYRDLTVGKPVEADQIIGDMMVRANQLGVSTPLLEAAFASLKIYQNRLPSS